MSDLISKSALLAEFEPDDDTYFYTRDVRHYIETAQTIEAVKVVHGRWTNREGPDEDMNVREQCSECGHSDTHSPTVKVPFCWFCGARMDGEEAPHEH